jgi:hypothetical protein
MDALYKVLQFSKLEEREELSSWHFYERKFADGARV